MDELITDMLMQAAAKRRSGTSLPPVNWFEGWGDKPLLPYPGAQAAPPPTMQQGIPLQGGRFNQYPMGMDDNITRMLMNPTPAQPAMPLQLPPAPAPLPAPSEDYEGY